MGETDGGAEAASRFEREAAASGLALPTARRLNPRLAAAAIAVLIAASLAVGYSTGWMNLSHARPNPLAELPGCAGGISLRVDTEAGSSASLTSLWGALTSSFSSATGGCLSVDSVSTANGFDALGSASVAGLIGPEPPATGSGNALANESWDIPLLVAPVVVLVNLPGDSGVLNLSGAALAGVYLGTVNSWSAAGLAGPNPGLRSSLNVTPVHLVGPSWANELFSRYLSQWNATFQEEVGSGANVSWPAGPGAASPSAVVSLVAGTPGAVGFLPGAVCPSLPAGVACAALQSGTTDYVSPTAAAVTAAASLEANSSAAVHGAWGNVSGVAPVGSAVYPMLETTYAVVYRDLGNAYGSNLTLNQSKWLIALLFWVASDTAGTPAALADASGYQTLPSGLAIMAEETDLNVTYLGSWILIPASALQEGPGEGGNETGEF